MFNWKLDISIDAMNYLETLGLSEFECMCIENDEKEKLDTLDQVKIIKALFACNKAETAYERIINHKRSFTGEDFKDIMSSPFMQLDRTATDLYKYMHDEHIIDDDSYAYFEVLSGKLNDWEFWAKRFDGKSTTEILNNLHNAFNDIFVAKNVNPYELGLVTLTEEQDEYIFSRLMEGEKVDFLFAESPSINVLPARILDLLMDNHLNNSMAGYYLKIVYHMLTVIADQNMRSSESFTEENDSTYLGFWKFVTDYCKKYELSYVDTVKAMDLETLDKLINFIRFSYATGHSFNAVLDVAINNMMTINYPYEILKAIYGGIGIDFINRKDSGTILSSIDVSEYLDDDKMGLVLSYYLHPIFETSAYFFKYPFPHGFPIVYNTNTKKLLLGSVVCDARSGNPFGFVDDYLFAETVDDNIFKNFSSIEDYREFIYASKELREQIRHFELNYAREVNQKPVE